MVLIRLRRCIGWSAPLLFTNPRRQVFSGRDPFTENILITFRNVTEASVFRGETEFILNQFADMTKEEFKAKILMPKRKYPTFENRR